MPLRPEHVAHHIVYGLVALVSLADTPALPCSAFFMFATCALEAGSLGLNVANLMPSRPLAGKIAYAVMTATNIASLGMAYFLCFRFGEAGSIHVRAVFSAVLAVLSVERQRSHTTPLGLSRPRRCGV